MATSAWRRRDVDPASDPLLMELLSAGLLCNDAELRQIDGDWRSDGDPMEAALVALAMKGGLDPALLRKQLPRSDEIPFDALHRFMATLHHSHDGRAFVLIKGAPERILAMCASERRADGDVALDSERWHRAAMELAARGERVLGFAMKPVAPDKHDLTFADVDADAILLGFVGFLDPPREEAIAAIRIATRAGIRVVMITGDHATTAREIARQLGIADDPKVLTGQEIDRLDDGMRCARRHGRRRSSRAPRRSTSCGWCEALQADGLIVAMTGDGVNDAPALKRADVGVAMGEKGTEVAKEAAQVVLADDNFASIVAAVARRPHGLRQRHEGHRLDAADQRRRRPHHRGGAGRGLRAAHDPRPDPVDQHDHRGGARAHIRLRADGAGHHAAAAASGLPADPDARPPLAHRLRLGCCSWRGPSASSSGRSRPAARWRRRAPWWSTRWW